VVRCDPPERGSHVAAEAVAAARADQRSDPHRRTANIRCEGTSLTARRTGGCLEEQMSHRAHAIKRRLVAHSSALLRSE
jgi:hypothetical protein